MATTATEQSKIVKKNIKIATRKSPLALWQANWVKSQLEQHHVGLTVELVGIQTEGDRNFGVSLAKIGGKGLFIKELERAILDQNAHIAVHSLKDVTMTLQEGFHLAAICRSDDPADAFVSNQYGSLAEMPAGSIVGTSSLRRQAHLKRLHPDLQIQAIRGNVQTRLAKLDDGQIDAVLLACAGLKRLDLGDRITERLSIEQWLPAVGQGVIAIESLIEDITVNDLLQPLHHQETNLRITAERAMNLQLNGGCQAPIAGHAVYKGDEITLSGFAGSPTGEQFVEVQETGAITEAESLGIRVAERLLEQGAAEILAACQLH